MHRTAGLGASFFQYYEKEKYTEDVTDRFEILQKLDDKQIEQYADNMIEYVRDQGHLATLLGLGIFTGGLFSL